MIERNWNELIPPEKPLIETGADARRKARLVAEPLERGFGVTLGNSLRRVLLSSLQGAAVTAVQIDGVVHEFSSMEGVRADVVDIVLNIKQLAVRMHSEGTKRMTLRATGPGAVTASQIEAPGDIEITAGLSGARFELIVSNLVTEATAERFAALLAELTSRDPGELLIERIEANAADETSSASGLGLLTLMNDYGARLGWNFDRQGTDGIARLSTYAALDLN